jgi:hypothetical protein
LFMQEQLQVYRPSEVAVLGMRAISFCRERKRARRCELDLARKFVLQEL